MTAPAPTSRRGAKSMRALKVTALLAAVVVMAVILVVGWVVGTEQGTRFVVERIAAREPAGVRLQVVEGRLVDRLVVGDVELEHGGWHVRLERVEWTWAASALWSRQLLVESLDADGVTFTALPADAPSAAPPPPAEPFSLPARIELPLAVRVRRAAVRDLRVIVPGAEPLHVEAIETAGTLVDSRLLLERLDARSQAVDLRAAVQSTLAGDYPVAGTVEWQLRLAGYPEVEGTTQLDGTLAEALETDTVLGAPYNTRASLRLTDLLAAPDGLRLVVGAEISALELAALDTGLTPLSVSAALDARGPLNALEVEGRLTAVGLEQGLVEAELAGLIEPRGVLIRHLRVTQPTHAGSLQAEGRIGFEETIAADLDISWQRLQWPLEGAPTVSSPRGEARLTGPPEDYRLSLAAELLVPEQPPLGLELTGEGGLEALALELTASTPAGRASGSADLRWAPALEARVELAGEDFDVGPLLPSWPGRIGFQLRAAAAASEELIDVRVEHVSAAGDLRGEALALDGRGRYHYVAAAARHSVEIEGLRLGLGGAMLEVDGHVDETADLNWRLRAPELEAFFPGTGGSLAGAGTVTGALPLPRIEARLEGAGLMLESDRLEHVAIEAYLDPAAETRSSLSVEARDGRLAGIDLERFWLEGFGTPGDHRLAGQLQTVWGDAELSVEGRLTEPLDAGASWLYRVTDARLTHPELPTWHLGEPAAGRLSLAEASIDRHCWTSDDAVLCLAASLGEAAMGLELELRNFALAHLAPLVPPDYGLGGRLSAAGSLGRHDGRPLTGQIEIATEAAEITVQVAPQEVVPLRLEPSHARLLLVPGETVLELALNLEHGHLRLDATLPDAAGGDGELALAERPLHGALSVALPDLAFAAQFLPDLSETAGTLGGALELGGTLASPELTGRIALLDGRAHVPAAGVTVTDVNVLVEGRGDDTVALSASATSGGGRAELGGELTLLNEVPTARLHLRGDGFRMADTREGRLYVTPDLQIVADRQRVDVSGEVRVPRAVLTPGSGAAAAAVRPSADQILLVSETEEREPPRAIRDLHARVRIILGDAVTFDGYGLTARLTGNVLAVQAPGAPTTATGELNIVDGEYRAYGQVLVIETGNIYFAGGPLTEPALDVRAVRRPQPGILVGAHVVGPLEEPQFTLFSEPPMSQQEQLSYLVLGRSPREAQSGERSALSHAALAMGLRGGDFIARNIGERIGVDELSIETGNGQDPSGAALVAGKYLSPRLYVSYGIGLFDTVNVLRIQYTIADRWRIVTQSSSEASGADVVYTRERGR